MLGEIAHTNSLVGDAQEGMSAFLEKRPHPDGQ
jgi:hypothetical protein